VTIEPTPRTVPGMAAAVAAFCGRGLVRPANEDAVALDGRRVSDEHVHSELLSHGEDHFVVVADGMGGHAKGNLASSLAVERLNDEWATSRGKFDALKALREANRHLYDAMERQPGRAGMGATVAGFHLSGHTVSWFNVGDSRLYLFRSGRLRQLSVDHVPRGDTSAGKPERSHLVTQSLGGAFGFRDVWPAIGQEALLQGDVLLACSDGLTDPVPAGAIADIIRSASSAGDCTGALVDAATANGAPDNLSVVVVSLLSDSAHQAELTLR